jgi:hypothetical protein
MLCRARNKLIKVGGDIQNNRQNIAVKQDQEMLSLFGQECATVVKLNKLLKTPKPRRRRAISQTGREMRQSIVFIVTRHYLKDVRSFGLMTHLKSNQLAFVRIYSVENGTQISSQIDSAPYNNGKDGIPYISHDCSLI